jgi:hypothetical protein
MLLMARHSYVSYAICALFIVLAYFASYATKMGISTIGASKLDDNSERDLKCLDDAIVNVGLFLLIIIAPAFTIAGVTSGHGALEGSDKVVRQYNAVFAIMFMLLPTVSVFLLVYWGPMLIAGWAALRAPVPESALVASTLEQNRPDIGVEQKLAALLRSQHIDMLEGERLLTQLSPLQQLEWRSRLTKRAQELEKMVAMANAQERVLRAEADLGAVSRTL